MAVLVDMLGQACDAWLGCGLPVPATAVRAAAWAPDAPGTWCMACGSARCAGAAGDGPAGCAGAPGGGVDAVIRVGAHAGVLRDWVLAVKHRRWDAMAEFLGATLGRQLAACVAAAATPASRVAAGQGAVVVPVPMPPLRRWARGIDHAALLAREVARANGLRVVQPLRQRHAGSQVAAGGRAARLAHGERFTWRAASWASRRVEGRTVVLVDDVRTTGATLAAAAALLRAGGAAGVLAAVVSVRE